MPIETVYIYNNAQGSRDGRLRITKLCRALHTVALVYCRPMRKQIPSTAMLAAYGTHTNLIRNNLQGKENCRLMTSAGGERATSADDL